MFNLKKKCKNCHIEFYPRNGNRALLCRDCYCKKMLRYYYKKKQKVTCICNKNVDKTYLLKHLKSKLHERWLAKKIFFSGLLYLK